MTELINLMEAGFTERQALAILNAAHPKSIADLIVGVAFLVLLLVVVIASLCKSAGDYDDDENKYWKGEL